MVCFNGVIVKLLFEFLFIILIQIIEHKPVTWCQNEYGCMIIKTSLGLDNIRWVFYWFSWTTHTNNHSKH